MGQAGAGDCRSRSSFLPRQAISTTRTAGIGRRPQGIEKNEGTLPTYVLGGARQSQADDSLRDRARKSGRGAEIPRRRKRDERSQGTESADRDTRRYAYALGRHDAPRADAEPGLRACRLRRSLCMLDGDSRFCESPRPVRRKEVLPEACDARDSQSRSVRDWINWRDSIRGRARGATAKGAWRTPSP